MEDNDFQDLESNEFSDEDMPSQKRKQKVV